MLDDADDLMLCSAFMRDHTNLLRFSLALINAFVAVLTDAAGAGEDHHLSTE
jgi:hypothetical protein